MMGFTNISWAEYSDKALIETMGNFVKKNRLQQNKTQAQIAKAAGVNRWTLSQLENGQPVTMLSFIQILRALDLLNIMDAFTIDKQISPIQLAKYEQMQRKRARNNNELNEPDMDW